MLLAPNTTPSSTLVRADEDAAYREICARTTIHDLADLIEYLPKNPKNLVKLLPILDSAVRRRPADQIILALCAYAEDAYASNDQVLGSTIQQIADHLSGILFGKHGGENKTLKIARILRHLIPTTELAYVSDKMLAKMVKQVAADLIQAAR